MERCGSSARKANKARRVRELGRAVQAPVRSIQEDSYGFKMHLVYGMSFRLALSPSNQPTKQEKKKKEQESNPIKKINEKKKGLLRVSC